MASFYEHNLSALMEHHRETYERFCMIKANESLTVRPEPTKAGIPTLFIGQEERSGLLYSRYQPLVEAERWAAEQEAGDAKALVLAGVGLGYQLRALRQKFGPDVKLIAVEPIPEIFRTALCETDLTDLLHDENIKLVIGGTVRECAEQLGPFLIEHKFHLGWAEWPAYRRLFQSLVEELSRQVSQLARDIRLDQNTLLFFQRQWPRNILYNLSYILKNPGVLALKDKLKGRPAIIVSAGPSLAKNVDLLHDLKGRAAILCVDTAYRVLQRKGIQPDLIFVIDGSEKNYRHFDQVKPEGIPLVFLPIAHHKILEEYGARCFSANVFDPLVSEVMKHVEPKGALNTSGSVATLAFDTAYLAGANPIIFIGQDLAYPGGQAYAPGTINEKMIVTKEDNPHMMEVEGIDGKPVLTDSSLDLFRRWFERRIEEIGSERHFVDATEGGAKIKGTEILTLREAADRYCAERFDIQAILDEAAVPVDIDLTPAILELRKMSRVLHQIKRLARIALLKNAELRDLYKVRRLRTSKVAAVNAALDRIEKRIKELNEKKWLDMAMQHLLLTVTQGKLAKAPEQETEHARAMRVTANGELLYQGILEAASEIKDHVGVALRRLQDDTKQGENVR
jgi:hypothetical protein